MAAAAHRSTVWTGGSDLENYRFGRYEVRPSERSVHIEGTPVPLGARAFDLLLALVDRRDRVTSAEELLGLVWPGLVVEENNLRQQISVLRKALGPQSIATVARRGYRLVADSEGAPDGISRAPAVAPVTEAEAAVRRALTMRPVVAVMPFANLDESAAPLHIADAITQDIITGLARHRWLTVLARGTTYGYRNVSMDVQSLARELNADYVVAGSVRRNGSRLRVSVELVDAAGGASLWGQRYDRGRTDVFAVLDEVTDAIVGCLEPEIGHAERVRVRARSTVDLQAWDCLHLGLEHFFRFTAADNRQAMCLFDTSRRLDPTFGEPHAWWAYAAVLGTVYWEDDASSERLESALASVQRALEFDDQNAVFYSLKARVQLARRACEAAIDESRIAIELSPTLATAHCSLGDALAYLGRHDEAMTCFERALTLSPRDPQRWAFLSYGALALILHGDHESAVRWAARAEEIPNCSYWTPAHAAVSLANLGRHGEASAAVDRMLAKYPSMNLSFAERKLYYLTPEQRRPYLQGLARAGVPAG